MKTALFPVTAVTCNADFEVIEDAAIHIEDGRLRYVGPGSSAPEFAADEVWGGSHLVVMPGLINTHTHSAMTLLRGYADDMALEPWLQEKIWPFEKHLTADDVYWGTLLAIAEMARGGTTCFADMYFFNDAGLRAMLESGIRACPSAVLLGFLPGADAKIAAGLEWASAMRGAGDGRIVPLMGPHSLYTCNRPQWEKIIEGALAHGLAITTHAAETRHEVAQITAEWGQSPIATLEQIGALQVPLLAAHCVYTDERDREIMAARGLKVAHNPQSNLKLASGIAPVADYLRRGITVGLAPDGTASNNNLDMWEELRLAATLHKATTGDPTVVSARQALEMATSGGARCLGLEGQTGSLEIGKKADLAVLDFDRPHLTPRHNVVSHLVYAAGAADVVGTMVDGRWLYRDGEFKTLDVRDTCAKANAAATRLVAAASGA